MLVSSHVPRFLSSCDYWAKIAKSTHHVVLGGVPATKDDCVNKFQIRGSSRTLSLIKETRHGSIKNWEFVSESLEKIVASLKQELCCRRFSYHARIERIVEMLEGFPNTNFLKIAFDTNFAISKVLGLELEFAYDTEEDPITSKTTSLFLPVDRKVLGGAGYNYLASKGSKDYLNRHEIPIGKRIYVEDYTIPPYNGNSVLQLIAEELDPLTELLKMTTQEPFP